ncbi:unnamed protein product [Miscanthus lutarioriparius]|uniref:Uncharacterized protein n=1 Tax=Miscanthus lutarioriparius TaxID=422564 RepID=A0A811SFE2_9POAL|nr:unnamed protein product [Miscanthus lutarioriparius]
MFCILLLDEDAASRTLPYRPAVPGYAAAQLLQLGDVYGNDEHRSQGRSCDWACFRGTTIVDSNILTPMATNERSHLPLEEEAEHASTVKLEKPANVSLMPLWFSVCAETVDQFLFGERRKQEEYILRSASSTKPGYVKIVVSMFYVLLL